MSVTDDFILNLSKLETLSLRFRPKAEIQIEMASALANAFSEMNDEERSLAIIQVNSLDIWKRLLALSGYLAETAINIGSGELLRYALIMHLIAGFDRDYRENIRYLILIYFSAKKMGIDLGKIIDSVADIAPPNAKQHLAAFYARDSSLNKLDSVGVKEDATADLFRFVPI